MMRSLFLTPLRFAVGLSLLITSATFAGEWSGWKPVYSDDQGNVVEVREKLGTKPYYQSYLSFRATGFAEPVTVVVGIGTVDGNDKTSPATEYLILKPGVAYTHPGLVFIAKSFTNYQVKRIRVGRGPDLRVGPPVEDGPRGSGRTGVEDYKGLSAKVKGVRSSGQAVVGFLKFVGRAPPEGLPAALKAAGKAAKVIDYSADLAKIDAASNAGEFSNAVNSFVRRAGSDATSAVTAAIATGASVESGAFAPVIGVGSGIVSGWFWREIYDANRSQEVKDWAHSYWDNHRGK
jgi:hypothetical protein